jgi:hypothetical protein
VPTAVVFDDKRRDNGVHSDQAFALGLATLQKFYAGGFRSAHKGIGRFLHCGSHFGTEFMWQARRVASFVAFGATKVPVFTFFNSRRAVMDRTREHALVNRGRGWGLRTSVIANFCVERKAESTEPAAADLGESTSLKFLVANRELRQEETRSRLHKRGPSSRFERRAKVVPFSQSAPQRSPLLILIDPTYVRAFFPASLGSWSRVVKARFKS